MVESVDARESMMDICDYGCGQKAEYEMSNGKACCSENFQSCPAIRKKNSDSLKKAYERGDKNAKHLDGHRGWKKGKLTVDKKILLSRQ